MTTRQQAHRRREAAIATAKTAVTVASVAAALGGCALIGLTDSAPAAVQDTNTSAPQQISANVTVVGSPTPIPSATPSASTANSGQVGVPTRTPRPTATPAPTQTIIQPGLRQPGFGNNNFFVPRTRTSR